MAEDLAHIRRFVSRLTWRERSAILLDIAIRTLVLGFVGLLLMVLAAGLHWDRSQAAATLVLLVGAGMWVAVVLPLLTRWRSSGDLIRQARLVEAHEPELRGRLITAVERVDGPAGGESPALLGLVARRANERLASVEPSSIHRLGRRLLAVPATAALLVLPLILTLFAGGPGAVLSWWLAGFDARAAIDALDLDSDADKAQVGNLLLRYTYPQYTGLDSRVVENSTGDVAAPPGTLVEVTARSAERIEAAGLVAYEQRFEATVADNRVVTGSFTVEADAGTYRLVTWRGESSMDSRDFQITPEEDLAPEVMLDAEGDVLELALDESFNLQWEAADDFGVARVSMRVGGEAVGRPLFRMTERKAEAFGDVWRSPQELGLSPGDDVELDVAAWDNDSVGGSKVGVSRPIRLVVLGPKGLDTRFEERMQEILEAMLTALADHLVDEWPETGSSGDLARWGEQVAKRYQPLQDIVDDDWERMDENSIERQALGEVVRTGGDLVRYTQVAFDPRSKEPPVADALVDTVGKRDDAIVALEDGILAIDRTLRMRALREVLDAAEKMEQIGQELEEMMAREDVDPLEMLAQLEHLEQMMQELAEAAAKMQEGGLKEFVNSRNDEMKSLMEEIREALAKGDKEEAKKLMERLAKQLQQLAEGVRDNMERQQQEGSDAMAKADELKAELERLEKEERALQEEVKQLREQEDSSEAEKAAEVWKELQREASALVLEIEAYRSGLVQANRDFNEVTRTEHTVLSAERLRDSAVAEDLRGATNGHRATSNGVDKMYRALQNATFNRPDLGGPARGDINRLYAALDRIEKLLEQLDQGGSASQSAKTQELEQKQQELQQQLQQAQQQAQELGEEFPVRPKGMEERLEEANERMGEAGEDLRAGRPMPAEGSQGAAADRIREAREALEKAMQQAQQQQQQLQQGQQSKKSGGEDGESRDFDDRPQVEIPSAEDFRTPEEYRRALLEGMEGEVPEEFRALKKRYFEELVRQ